MFDQEKTGFFFESLYKKLHYERTKVFFKKVWQTFIGEFIEKINKLVGTL